MSPKTGELDETLMQYKESFGARAVIREKLRLDLSCGLGLGLACDHFGNQRQP